MLDARIRRARAAVAVLFAANGALFANLVPRFPELKTELGLSNTGLGLAVAAFSAGALVCGLTAGGLVRKLGSARVAVLSSVLLAGCTVLAGAAPSGAAFAAAMFVAGAADAVTDVAQNHQGLWVQRSYGRSIINGLHATWSVGAIAGGLIAALGMALGVGRVVQLSGTAVLFGLAAVLALRHLLPGVDSAPHRAAEPNPDRRRRAPRTAWIRVAALAALAISGSIVEDSGSSWATLYLHDELGAPEALAAFGFIALVSLQFVGRLIGDRLVDRFSERAVVRSGGLLVALGMGLTLAWPSVPGTIAGFAVVGLGIATAIPAAFHGADAVPGLRPGTGLTAVTWLMRFGFLISPPIVGSIADVAGLRVGLLAVVVAGLGVALCAGALPGRRATRR